MVRCRGVGSARGSSANQKGSPALCVTSLAVSGDLSQGSIGVGAQERPPSLYPISTMLCACCWQSHLPGDPS